MKGKLAVLSLAGAFALALALGSAAAQRCDDGLFCTGPDTCVEGECVGASLVCQDDGNACTLEECDEERGGCVHTPIVCDDLNPCTVDTCDPATGCVYTKREEGATCADQFQCTSNDRCHTAFPFVMVCDVPSVPVNPCVRPLGNACENHQCVCSSDADCQMVIHPDLARKCLEGRCVRTCTGPGDCPLSALGDAQVCVDGECWVQLPLPICLGDLPTEGGQSCDDQLQCTSNDRCQIFPVTIEGIPKEIPVPICLGDALPENTSCPNPQGDQLQCTTNDRCRLFNIEVEGVTLPMPVPVCLGDPATNGSPCADPNGDHINCTMNDRCQTQEIEGFPIPVSVCMGEYACPQDQNLCTAELCDPEEDRCVSVPVCGGDCQTGCDPGTGECIAKANGTLCDDEDLCTVNDQCKEGYCEGVAPGEVPTPTPTPEESPSPTATLTHTSGPTGTPTETATATLTGKPSNTPQPTYTDTPTVTVTPTSCGADPALVDALTSPTSLLQQTITGDARLTGARDIRVTSDAGLCTPGTVTATHFEVVCDLLPGQTNHVEVCIINQSCGDNACTTTDRNGDPLEIVQLSATSTPSVTATATQTGNPSDTPTLTPTETQTAIPTLTPTVGVTPTASITATPKKVCPGDCDGLGTVTVDELVKGVNIALGTMGIETCEAFDANESGTVTIDELIKGVNAALQGCSVVMSQ
jgi:hypothetical protein